MRKFKLAPWALAAVMAVAAPGAHSAWALSNTAATGLISSQLPPGVTLSKASIKQTGNALSAAVSQQPGQAGDLTRAALLAKTSKRARLPATAVVAIVEAAIKAAPQKANDIIQAALTIYPEYADQLDALVLNPVNNNAPNGFDNPSDNYGGFGVGFGAGFPGSPGFFGSAPSGGIALPPSPTNVTPDTGL